MMYNCSRCGYESDKKSHLKRHLQRKRACLPKLEDIEIDEIYKENFGNDLTNFYKNKTTFLTKDLKDNQCSFCGKTFYDKSTTRRHMKNNCKENPSIKYKESQNNIESKSNTVTMEKLINTVMKKLKITDIDTEIEPICPVNEETLEGDSKFTSIPKCKETENETKEIDVKETAIKDYIDGNRNKLDCCINENCDKMGKYNIFNEIYGLYCANHAYPNMINVITGKCHDNYCGVGAYFNYHDETKGIYCDTHKKENMVNVLVKKCIEEGCIKIPLYNYKEEITPIYCTDHKIAEMVDVKNKNKYCQNCIDWPDPRYASRKYNNYCARCFQQLFPTDALTLAMRSKTKEIAVRDFINTKFVKFQHDIPLYTGDCNCIHRRRIDHRRIIDNTILAIETDENQHKYYNKHDEEIRYDDLYMVHSGKWIFIRFNPDKYANSKGQNKNTKMENRLKMLESEIRHQMSRIVNEENTELVEIIYLYYDGYE